MLQNILSKIARGKIPTPKQKNVVIQAMIQEQDSGKFDWVSNRLKTHCPKSVEMINKYLEMN
jgi:hypothetical protein